MAFCVHLHRLLVCFEQFTGEFTEDGQIGEIRRCSCVRSLTGLLERKLDAASEHDQKTNSGKRQSSKAWRDERLCRPVDHDDTLAKLDKVAKGESKPPGKLLDGGECLKPWVGTGATHLFLL